MIGFLYVSTGILRLEGLLAITLIYSSFERRSIKLRPSLWPKHQLYVQSELPNTWAEPRDQNLAGFRFWT